MRFKTRLSLLVFIDIVMIWLSIITSYVLRFNFSIPEVYMKQAIVYSLLSTVICVSSMFYFKLYKRVWRYASIGELTSIIKAVVIGCTVSYLLILVLHSERVPFSIYLKTLENTVILMGGIRFLWRIVRDRYIKRAPNKPKALIIGAGDCGLLIARELKHRSTAPYYAAAFIDDDARKHNYQVLGIPVIGGRERIISAVEEMNISEIVIAMPSVSREVISEIIGICKQTKAKLKIIPRLGDLINGRVTLNAIRDVQVEDLLGREPVNQDLAVIAEYLQNKTVLVTGAGGSIGSELCRQIAQFKPARLLLLGHGENSIYNIEMELRGKINNVELVSVIADVQDVVRIDHVFRTYRPEVVFHAAAHKHVPLMEMNPAEAIKNNIFGTRNVAEASDRYGVDRFVLVSTDKAVNPTSVMGATKRVAEMLIQCLDKHSKTKFAVVRFGNVLGSRGSVIPRFKEQIAAGGPVTVTHPEMVRYFMTIPEAVQLVIQAGAFAHGGEVFVLDMGKPVRILTLAEDLIKLSGLEPYHDIRIEFSGIRPGEKLYEELLMNEENMKSTKHDRIFIGSPMEINRNELDFELKKLERVINEDALIIKDVLRHIVPTYENVS